MQEALLKIGILAVGGAVGANARFWLGRWIATHSWAQHFPIGTFIVNISGSLLFAVVALLFLEKPTEHRLHWFLLLGTGFCGAYTTFSTFEWETLMLIRTGQWGFALLNVFGSVLAGFVAVLVVVHLME